MKRLLPLCALLPLTVLLASWQIFASASPERLFLFGSPAQIFNIALQELPRMILWHDIAITVSAMLLGLALGTTGGTATGLMLAVHPVARSVSRPYLAFLASIQIFTVAPLMIMWFGIGWGAKVAMATIATFFLASHQAASGAAAMETRYLAYAQSLASPRHILLLRIVLPGAMRWVLAGTKLNLGFAALGVLVGEYISSEHGLGHYIFMASGVYDVSRAWFGILLLALTTGGLAALADGVTRIAAPIRR